MKFKEWINKSLLLEFKASNFYDFYALELASKQMGSKEVEDLIVDRGNTLYSEIISALGFLLFLRYGSLVRHCMMTNTVSRDVFKFRDDDFPDEYKGIISKYIPIFDYATQIPRLSWRNTLQKNEEAYNMWLAMNVDDQKELVIIARETLLSIEGEGDCNIQVVWNTFSDRWDSIYNYFINNVTSEVITKPAIVVRMINSLTQLVHNSGNILQYMPEELDKAIHVRDTATLSQLLYGASPTVKELLRSALLPSGGLVEEAPPALPQLLLTAMSRSLNNHKNINHIELLESNRNIDLESGIYKIYGKLVDSNNKTSNCTFNIKLTKRKTRSRVIDLPKMELDLSSIKNSVLNKIPASDWLNISEYMKRSELLNKPLSPRDVSRFDYIQAGGLFLDHIDSILEELSLFYNNMIKYGTWHRSEV